ncbi:hypothetical protein Ddye_014001 [Dipteronia dyeriana]|uniref:PAP/OAS1 substrate-binding-related domain-containing protein n=1 Tax=Dipteronia dyeriana TaxID=168575 RepID=A0AAE0CK37_9ROSI|nr:hypothetical protein Ddye_014001 [Dipteronia dyeriana]
MILFYGISCFNNNHKESFVIIGSDYCVLYTTIDPPRRDGGELLLSESVYAYIAAYTVLPLGQRNPDFKLKCFNIIDPLLWNNNLGISVDEENFSRILRACSDGAQQLAKLLDCPEEDAIAEVDRFSERHGIAW